MNSLIASLGCAGPMLKWLDVRPSVVVDRDSRAEFTEKASARKQPHSARMLVPCHHNMQSVF